MIVIGGLIWSFDFVERIVEQGGALATALSLRGFYGTVDPAEPVAQNAVVQALKFRDLLLTIAISLGTYVGSVRHIKKVHKDLKDHISKNSGLHNSE